MPSEEAFCGVCAGWLAIHIAQEMQLFAEKCLSLNIYNVTAAKMCLFERQYPSHITDNAMKEARERFFSSSWVSFVCECLISFLARNIKQAKCPLLNPP